MISQAVGDSPLSLKENSPRQISPRENQDTMMNIIERTHALILVNRESKKLR